MRASDLFSRDDVASIESAIDAAERATDAEIVPVVASASGRYDRAEDLFGLCLALITLATAWIALDSGGPGAASWASAGLGLGAALALVLVGFVVGAALASRITVLRLPFISRAEMHEEVERGAREAFQRERIRTTTNGAGVLIYVSLHERLVRVLADDRAAEHLSAAMLEEICALVTDGLKRGAPADGLRDAISRTGELLANALPASGTSELPNRLVLRD
jgi:putative membrane protein